MVDLDNKTLIAFAQVARMFPGKISPNTVARRALHGTNGVLLDSIEAGRRRFTSKEAVHRYIYHQSERPDRREPTPDAKRRAAIANAEVKRMAV